MSQDNLKEIITALQNFLGRLEAGERPAESHLDTMVATIAGWNVGLRSDGEKIHSDNKPTGEKTGDKTSDGSEALAWCDGSCAPNPGVGGWGAIVEIGGNRTELSGASPRSTNNIMELTAAIEALKHTPPGSRVRITTDSQYVKNGITQWINGWKRRGWRKADGEPVLNKELWQALEEATLGRQVQWEWVRGHTGHPENERCDELANEARLSLGE